MDITMHFKEQYFKLDGEIYQFIYIFSFHQLNNHTFLIMHEAKMHKTLTLTLWGYITRKKKNVH